MPVHYVHHLPMPTIDIGPHVFPIEKYAILCGWLRSELGVDDDRWHPAGPIDRADLERVHTPEYVDDLMHARASPATVRSELPIREDVIAGFIAMAGGAITTAQLAVEHGVGFHVGGGLHHAYAGHAEGFCYVNDVAVAIARMRHDGLVRRVLVVDVDVHQGNGTAAIFSGDPDTYTYSIHQENNYPIKEKSTLDRGLPDGIRDDAYIAMLVADLTRVDYEGFRPDLVWYLAGVDPYGRDQLGGLSLSADGLRRRDAFVLERFIERGLPIAISLAGGYAPSPQETAELHMGTILEAEALANR